jgi:hypothetical protein
MSRVSIARTRLRVATDERNAIKRARRRKVFDGYPKEEIFKTREQVEDYFSGDKIVCLLCGKEFKSLQSHLKVHGVGAEEYKERYSLPKSVGLCGKASRLKRRDVTVRRRKAGTLNKIVPAESINRSGSKYKPRFSSIEHIEAMQKGDKRRGEKHQNTNLSESDVLTIYKSNMLQKELAVLYNVNPATISNIKRGVTWGHITKGVSR